MTPLEAALVKKGVTLLASKVSDKLAEVLHRTDLEWARASANVDAEILVEAAWRVKQLEDRVDEIQGRFLVHLDDHAHSRIRMNYVLEATREAMDERYNMLVSAAAETMLSALPAGEKSRTERVLRELDPRDVRELAAIAAERSDGKLHDDQVRRNRWTQSRSRDELVAAGCIRVKQRVGTFGGAPGVDVTARGALVLEMLHSWLEGRA